MKLVNYQLLTGVSSAPTTGTPVFVQEYEGLTVSNYAVGTLATGTVLIQGTIDGGYWHQLYSGTLNGPTGMYFQPTTPWNQIRAILASSTTGTFFSNLSAARWNH